MSEPKHMATHSDESSDEPAEPVPSSLLYGLIAVFENWRTLVLLPLLVMTLGIGMSYLLKPVFTAKTTVLPPQQSPQSSAIAALGSLANLATSGSGLRSSADLYASLLQSAAVEAKLVEKFKLQEVYGVDLKTDAMLRLRKQTGIEVGKKDGLITLTFEDENPVRAAEIANSYIAELRRVTAELALTEAQQRRAFFETRLEKTKNELAKAQRELQSSGFSGGSLRAEPRLAAETYARTKAELTTAELKLLTLRDQFADGASEVQRQLSLVGALRAQLARAETPDASQGDAQYIGRYRDYKYQESLFELFSRQYELARTDEAREGALIQVVDAATPPQKRSKPKRRLVAVGSLIAGVLLALAVVGLRQHWRYLKTAPEHAALMLRLRTVMGRR